MNYRLLINCTVLLLLSGCETQMFGMPESQFRALNPGQQQQVINAYHQRELIRTQNEPLNSLIGVAGQAVNQLGNRNNSNPAPAAPSRPSFPDIRQPSFPSAPSMPSIPQYNFKPGECHMEGNTRVCHHEEHHSSSSGEISFR